MWNGKMKALTFSYDDGLETDARLVEIFNRYGMKCTFNLNGGRLYTRENLPPPYMKTSRRRPDVTPVYRLPLEDMPAVYAGHEIAGHCYNHPFLAELPREEVEREISRDIETHIKLFGKRPLGMAYPQGSYNDMVVDVVRANGLRYARTSGLTGTFDMPEDLLRLKSTCHHNNPRLMELAEAFANMQPDTPQLFYIYGHSYEFAADDNWDVIERFCSFMAGHDDIFYGTNAEVLLD